MVQCRVRDAFRQASLVERLKQRIQSEFGIACLIELVPLHTLPRTSSGKLSRSGARLDFIRRNGLDDHPVLSRELVDRTPAYRSCRGKPGLKNLFRRTLPWPELH